MQLFRYDLDSGRVTLLTDGKSRHGIPVWSHRRGLVAYSSTRRNGKDRDLWVMNPLEDHSERMIAEVDGSWDALDWSLDDKELLAQQLIPARRKPNSGASTSSPAGRRSSRRDRIAGALVVRAVQRRRPFCVRAERSRLRSHSRLERRRRVRRVDAGYRRRRRRRGLCRRARRHTARRRRRSRRDERVAVRGRNQQGKAPRVDDSCRRDLESELAPSGTTLAIEFAGARTFRDVYAVDVKSGKLERWTASEMGGAGRLSARSRDRPVEKLRRQDDSRHPLSSRRRASLARGR